MGCTRRSSPHRPPAAGEGLSQEGFPGTEKARRLPGLQLAAVELNLGPRGHG